MRRAPFVLGLALVPWAAWSQLPDVRAHLDLGFTLESRDDRRPTGRLYTPLGRPSVVGLTALLDAGYTVTLTERLQRLPGDADGDIFDEAYIEDPGIWRIGKQYIPFGTGRILHESVAAARIDSNLIAENFPVTFAFVDSGAGRQNGAMLRLGRSVGLSAAVGEHFGCSATSLGIVRRPEEGTGRNKGWKQVLGFDGARRWGKLDASAEYVALLGGPRRQATVIDTELSYAADAYRSIGVGLSLATGFERTTFVRLFGRVHATRNVDVEPLVRLADARPYDAAVTLRVRF